MILEDMSIDQLDKEIKKHQDEISKLEAAKTAFQELTEVQRLATLLHKKQCHHNHTDGCGWYYGSWTDKHSRHSERNSYLEKAQKLLDTGHSFKEIMKIAEIL